MIMREDAGATGAASLTERPGRSAWQPDAGAPQSVVRSSATASLAGQSGAPSADPHSRPAVPLQSRRARTDAALLYRGLDGPTPFRCAGTKASRDVLKTLRHGGPNIAPERFDDCHARHACRLTTPSRLSEAPSPRAPTCSSRDPRARPILSAHLGASHPTALVSLPLICPWHLSATPKKPTPENSPLPRWSTRLPASAA